MIRSFIGKNVSELEAELSRRAERNAKHRRHRAEAESFWREQLERHGDVLLSVDTKEIDTFNTGVNIYVLLNSRYAFTDQCNYVKTNKKDCVQFIFEVLRKKRKNKILDLLNFCKITRVVVTRSNEACFTFELKDEIQKILQD